MGLFLESGEEIFMKIIFRFIVCIILLIAVFLSCIAASSRISNTEETAKTELLMNMNSKYIVYIPAQNSIGMNCNFGAIGRVATGSSISIFTSDRKPEVNMVQYETNEILKANFLIDGVIADNGLLAEFINPDSISGEKDILENTMGTATLEVSEDMKNSVSSGVYHGEPMVFLIENT